jgi:predicted peptidase
MRNRSASTAGIKTRSYFLEEAGETVQYSVYVPGKIDPAEKSPLVIALHGMGVPPQLMLGEIKRAAAKGGYIVAAPTGYNLSGWYGAQSPNSDKPVAPQVMTFSERDVMHVLARMREEFNIDDRRIYLIGQSMGGAGALHLGIKYRDIWAAVAATAPAIRDEEPQGLENIRDMPVIFVHGTADRAVPIERTRRWVQKMQELGMTYEFHEIRGGSHGSALRSGAPHVFAFFDKHSKPAAGN